MAIVIRAKPGEKIDSLIARFRKAIAREGLLDEARDRMAYKKDSQKRQDLIKKKKVKIKEYKRNIKKYG